MKNKFQLAFSITALFAFGLACNMSTANLSSFKVGKDENVKTEASTFKSGEKIYGVAVVSNAPGETTVKFQLTADAVEGMTKGETIKGSNVDVKVPDGGGTATYSLTVPNGAPGGKYIITADMHNDAGEKKDSKSASITIEGSEDDAP